MAGRPSGAKMTRHQILLICPRLFPKIPGSWAPPRGAPRRLGVVFGPVLGPLGARWGPWGV
eukprot:9167089-Pyramimonas_sp.AAC.1